MSRWMIGILLFLAIPMMVLNPLGRPAFIGYYVGVISTWLAYLFALHGKHANLRSKQLKINAVVFLRPKPPSGRIVGKVDIEGRTPLAPGQLPVCP